MGTVSTISMPRLDLNLHCGWQLIGAYKQNVSMSNIGDKYVTKIRKIWEYFFVFPFLGIYNSILGNY